VTRRVRVLMLLVATTLAAMVAVVAAFEWRASRRPAAPTSSSDSTLARDAQQIRRGEYLARAGNCAGCHTARGGEPFAGGKRIDTPFGPIASANLTPDVDTGLAAWSRDDFRRALHEGRAPGGRLIVPACPYPNFTLVTRDDTDAIHAYLQTLPSARRTDLGERGLRFPYGLQASIAVWRALYFSPATFVDDSSRPPEWNRGRYLVQGLGHCGACHVERDALGAGRGDLSTGGRLPDGRWYAPSLSSPAEAGVSTWSTQDVVALLAHGRNAHASTLGPMAEVVFRSTQHLSEGDLRAMAVYLQSLGPVGLTQDRPSTAPPARASAPSTTTTTNTRWSAGAKLYDDHCADCHGAQGEGREGRHPPLAGNRAVTLAAPNNVVQVILHGGFAPATSGNPRPHGMPPFGHVLDDEAVAAVASYVRRSWGNVAGEVSTLEVMRLR
jgi:mono/diheme cytochrome c family protein